MATPGAATNGKPTTTRTSELVRFATAGSVDDGKSTLIGRLLYDTKSIFEDQLEHVEETKATRLTERGQTRADDRASDASMEDRKREGYF